MKRPNPTTAQKLPPPQKDKYDWFDDDEDEKIYTQVSSQRIASQRIASQNIVAVQQPQQSIQRQPSSYIPTPPLQPQSSSSSAQASVFKVPLPPSRNIRPQQNIRPTAPQPSSYVPRPAAPQISSFQRQPIPQSYPRPRPQSSNPRQPGPISTLNPRAPGVFQQKPPQTRPSNIPPRPQAIQQQLPRLPIARANLPRPVATTSTAVQTICDFQTSKLGLSKYQKLKGQLDLMWQMRDELKKPKTKFQDAFPKFNTFYDIKDS